MCNFNVYSTRCHASEQAAISLYVTSPYLRKLRNEIIYARTGKRPCAGSDATLGEGCHHLATCTSLAQAALPAVLQIVPYCRVAMNYPKRLSRCRQNILGSAVSNLSMVMMDRELGNVMSSWKKNGVSFIERQIRILQTPSYT